MRVNMIGIILGIIIVFLSLIVLPVYYIGVINWRDDMNTCQVSARNFVDMVIDNGQVTDKALSDLNLSLASCSGTFTYEYYKEAKVTNPSVKNENGEIVGFVETTWNYTEVDKNTTWNEGDLITIVIKQKKLNLFQRLSASITGNTVGAIDVRLSGMVR